MTSSTQAHLMHHSELVRLITLNQNQRLTDLKDSYLWRSSKKRKTMSMIAIEGMEFYAYHGCFEEEKIIGTSFMVDLCFNTDTSEAEKSDNLHKTVNYLEVYQTVKKEMQISSNLLEHISRRILLAVQREFPQVEWAKVKIQKLNPPLGGKMKSVSVTLTTEELK